MVQTIERSSPFGGLNDGLSESVIPAVPGEYYAYSSKFTDERPMYVLMKCKANKSRPIGAAEELGREANLLFLFGNPIKIEVCSVKEAQAHGLLGDSINDELFGETWIARAGITAEEFYDLRLRKDVDELARVCQVACTKREVSIKLGLGAVIAMMTASGKYGMFFVKEITSNSIKIDACHILLI